MFMTPTVWEMNPITRKIEAHSMMIYDFFAKHKDGNLEAEEVVDYDYGTQTEAIAAWIRKALKEGYTVETLNNNLEYVHIIGFKE